MLSSIVKGLILGAVNLFVCALVIALVEEPRDAMGVMLVVGIIGAGPALLVGGLAGWIAGRMPVFRRLMSLSLALTAIVVLGELTEPKLIKLAILPTLLGALLLERWTRPNLAAHEPRPNLTAPTTLGMLIGAANVVAVAVLLAIYVVHFDHRHRFDHSGSDPGFGLYFAVMVFCVGLIPGVVVGGIAGFLAKRLQENRLVVRLAGLGSVAVSGVFALASLTDTAPLAMPALMPTLFAVGILERMTRPIEIVPGARVHRAA